MKFFTKLLCLVGIVFSIFLLSGCSTMSNNDEADKSDQQEQLSHTGQYLRKINPNFRPPVPLTQPILKNITLAEFASIDFSDIGVLKIELHLCGEMKTISSQEEIDKIIRFLQSIKYRRFVFDEEKWAEYTIGGLHYHIIIYDKKGEDKNAIAFTFTPDIIEFVNTKEEYECSEKVYKGVSEFFSDLIDN